MRYTENLQTEGRPQNKSNEKHRREFEPTQEN